MLPLFFESLNILSVTAYHPLGWGLSRAWRSTRLMSPHVETPRLGDNPQLRHPVFFVHGIFHNSTAFYRLERRLQRRGFRHMHSVDFWTSIQNMEDMAAQLKREVRQELAHNPLAFRGRKARLVAHSLGGMITRVALLDPDFARQVDRVIFLGTPHQGPSIWRWSIPPCIKDLLPGSPLLQRLRMEPLPGNIEFWNVRGNVDLITPRRDTVLPGVSELLFDHVGHMGLLTDPRVLRSLSEILESQPKF